MATTRPRQKEISCCVSRAEERYFLPDVPGLDQYIGVFGPGIGHQAHMLPVTNMQDTGAFLGVERSATGRIWRDRLDARGQARALTIAQRLGVPELLARVMAGRGVEPEEAEAFLDPSIRRLMPDPHTLTDMEVAATRIADAVTRGEKVAIFGDYDVDGATSAALLTRFLRAA